MVEPVAETIEGGGRIEEQQLEHYQWRVLDKNIAGSGIGRTEEDIGLVDVKTFEQAGVQSKDRGMVVYIVGGAEYGITISRRP